MNAHTTIATGVCFQPYLDAARQNLAALVELAKGDQQFHDAASDLLLAFDDYALDCQSLIDAANVEPEGKETDRFWRDSFHAINAGLGE